MIDDYCCACITQGDCTAHPEHTCGLSPEEIAADAAALAAAGIIEQGYANASIARGYSAIRPPWEKKIPHAAPEVKEFA